MHCTPEQDTTTKISKIDFENREETWAIGFNNLPYSQCSSFYQGGTIMSSFFEDGTLEPFHEAISISVTFKFYLFYICNHMLLNNYVDLWQKSC